LPELRCRFGCKCEIDGLPFCFVQGETAQRLEDATLDWENGSFIVRERG